MVLKGAPGELYEKADVKLEVTDTETGKRLPTHSARTGVFSERGEYHVSFLLQDFCAESLAENFMMHILVQDVEAWWNHVQASGVVAKFGVNCTEIEAQPWKMKDFCLSDPSGVLWRIGQNTD